MTRPDAEHRLRMLLQPPRGASSSESLERLGELIDLAADLESDEGLNHALRLAEALKKRELSTEEQLTLHYYRGNTWLEKYAQVTRNGARAKDDWFQPELEEAVLALRTVIAHPAFSTWHRVRRAQLLTNLGNAFSTLGRALDAIEFRDQALKAVPQFGMALGTRAESLDAYRGVLHQRIHRVEYLRAAAEGFAAAAADAYFESPHYGPVIAKWTARGRVLQRHLDAQPIPLAEPYVSANDEAGVYRRWCMDERLVLDPLNDLGVLGHAVEDTLHLPPIAPHDRRAEVLFGFLDTMKQEYAFARWSLYEAMYGRRRHFSDLSHQHDTGDRPIFGISAERLKLSFRTAYSIFDKIGFFLNIYFELGIKPADVSFSKIWREKPEVLRPAFAVSRNWPLRGLYWIARDLTEPKFRDVIEPEAQALATIRNHLEHRYLRVIVTPPGHVMEALENVLVVSFDEFASKTLKLLKLARAAMITIAPAVFVEERGRGKGRGAWTRMRRL